MNAPWTLWRLGPAIPPDPDHDALSAGLCNHLAHAGIGTCLIQIAEAQRAYVALAGCPGCQMGRCVVGCRVELLRRTLRAALGERATLTLVRRGLDPLGYRRVIWAWPASAGAQPIDGAILAGWPRARMALSWRPSGPRRRVSALIALGGAGGPDVTGPLRAHGWACQEAPTLARRWLADPFGPVAHWRSGALGGAPWLLLPAPAPDTSIAEAP